MYTSLANYPGLKHFLHSIYSFVLFVLNAPNTPKSAFSDDVVKVKVITADSVDGGVERIDTKVAIAHKSATRNGEWKKEELLFKYSLIVKIYMKKRKNTAYLTLS